MSAGGYEYTIYFAWVPPDTPWSPGYAILGENIFDLVIEHDEGQIPTAIIEVINPRIGLINPSRNYWAWISFSYEACGPIPLMFGRLVGIPEQIVQNTVRMKFIARDTDYVYQKQQVARSLKVLPNYDELFFEVSKRDDPDAILEGWSALYHVDRINGRVSASDVLVGEDGTVNFAAQDVFYDSVQCKLLQSPLVAVNVKADVSWEQQWRGAFFVGQWAWSSLTGAEPFVGDWPKSGSSLGGGWSVGVAWAGHRDPTLIQTTQAQQFLQTQQLQQTPYTFSWTNQAKEHRFGDTMSININYTPPFGNTVLLKTVQQIGLQDPNAVDGYGNPAPVNRPSSVSQDWFCYKTLQQNFLSTQSLAVLSLVYAANRKRSERLEMTVTADVQPILTDPLLLEETEQITVKSGDLSMPLVNFQNWDSVGFGGAVNAGQYIFPDNPLVPGQTSTQIALNSGNTGSVFPTFSNIAGQTTGDGSVTWVSLGDTQPAESTQDWSRFMRVPLGTLLLPKPVSGVPDLNSIKIPGTLNYPPTGSAVPRYSIFSSGSGGPGDTMFECSSPGLLGGASGAPKAGFSSFTNPSGQTMYIATASGTSGEFHPTFQEGAGSQTTDGSIIWQSLGQVSLPIGGWPGGTPASAYFPQDRGQQSVQHMICRARAKLRKRARAVEVSFDTRFEVAAQLSCRMNGRVTDTRLPGGTAAGKVISYKLEAHGDTGVLKGSVVLGCSVGTVGIGLRQARAVDPGIPSYVTEGYVQRGYQRYYATGTTLTPGDIGYQPPGTPPAEPVVGGGEGPNSQGPITPPNWPTLPPTLPPTGCPPLNSYWSAGPSDISEGIGYSPPVSEPNDDGITFPASPSDLVLQSAWHGVASNPQAYNLYNLQLQQMVSNAVAQAEHSAHVIPPPPGSITQTPLSVTSAYDISVALQTAAIKAAGQGNALWYELVLKPLTNGPFASAYVIDVSPLSIPQTIDLSAPSTGGLLRHA